MVNIDELLEFLEGRDFNVTVDNNPSPERIEEIKNKIEANERHVAQVINRFNK